MTDRRTVLLTGYSGFLGRYVLPALSAAGHRVICMGRSPVPAGGEHVCADLAGEESWESVPWGEIETVLHLASAGVKASRRSWTECVQVNVQGTARLLAALSRAPKLERLIMTPTFYERLVPLHPALEANPYIATKRLATETARVWAQGFPGEVSFATLFQVYGPGDNSGNVLSYVASRLQRREKALLGSGRGQRDWIFVADVVEALVRLITLPAQPGVQIYDIGSCKLHSIRDVVERIASALHAPADLLDFDPARDRPDGDIALAATHPLLGWRANTTLDEGIRRLLLP